MTTYFTLVGSRDLPRFAEKDLWLAGSALIELGWIGRSGGAEGSDHVLIDVARTMGGKADIYLPWNGYNGYVPTKTGDIRFHLADTYYRNKAVEIVSKIHPVWNKLTYGMKALHTRNAFQPLGGQLDLASNVMLCYAPTLSNGQVKGGTNTCYQIARNYNIPIFNFFVAGQLTEFYMWLEDNCVN